MEMIWAIFLAAGFTQGVSGFGSALVAMPLLTLFMDVQMAAPLCMLNGLLITSSLSLQLRRHIDWLRIRPLLLGCVPGVVFGLVVLKNISNTILQICLGGLIIGYAVFNLLTTVKKPEKMSGLWPYVAGFWTGGFGSALGAGGPPTIIYVSLTGWSHDEIKASLSIFFFISGLFTALGHGLSGLTTKLVLYEFAKGAPFTLIGILAGVYFYNRINRRYYLKIMFWLLLVMGVGMLVKALF
ncbi:MAG: sulfite exporter TauE/SafE family protein [Desulfobulbaceae bacterium]|nr:sulfite exporter TauE/SafE family protein [Desulfobulbaceae bacterium]HIJ79435.1 sulfite exporter TauE/SafE family protein [Deltaproteobacteria bacterium]